MRTVTAYYVQSKDILAVGAGGGAVWESGWWRHEPGRRTRAAAMREARRSERVFGPHRGLRVIRRVTRTSERVLWARR